MDTKVSENKTDRNLNLCVRNIKSTVNNVGKPKQHDVVRKVFEMEGIAETVTKEL